MDISTLVYLSMGVTAFLVLFAVVAAIWVILLLQDIRMELRALNDNTLIAQNVAESS